MSKRKIQLLASIGILAVCLGLSAAGFNNWIQTVGLMAAGFLFAKAT